MVQSASGQRVLLTGDIGVAQEQALVAEGADLRADVLIVPHHGSASSSSAAWIAHVQPRFALVQAGYLNRYGHPAASVVQRYAAAGVPLITTPVCGAVHWHSAQPETVQCQRAIARKYWAHDAR